MSKDGQKSVKTRKGDTDYVAEGNTAKAVNEWAKIDEKHSRTSKAKCTNIYACRSSEAYTKFV